MTCLCRCPGSPGARLRIIAVGLKPDTPYFIESATVASRHGSATVHYDQPLKVGPVRLPRRYRVRRCPCSCRRWEVYRDGEVIALEGTWDRSMQIVQSNLDLDRLGEVPPGWRQAANSAQSEHRERGGA